MSARLLILGIGNPARQDDGLGPALVEALQALGLPGLSCEAAYQLAVEDAELVGEFDEVLFADARVDGPEPFSVAPLAPSHGLDFSSHALDPAAVLGLAEELFGKRPKAWTLGIRGREFQMLVEGLSEPAQINLAAAVRFAAAAVEAGSVELALSASKLPQT